MGRNILRDIGLYSENNFELDALFKFEKDGEYDGDRPVVFYFDDFDPSAVQLPVRSLDLVKQRAVDDSLSGEEWNRPFEISDNGMRFILYSYEDYAHGLISGERFITANDKAFLEGIHTAPPIAKNLTRQIQDLVNESGISVVAKVTEDFYPDLYDRYKDKSDEFSEPELQILRVVDELFESAQRGAMGLTYDEKCLNFSALVSFAENDAIDQLLNFDLAGEFSPTLGLPRDNLIASTSLRVNALQSTNGTRVLAKLLSNEFGSGIVANWLDGPDDPHVHAIDGGYLARHYGNPRGSVPDGRLTGQGQFLLDRYRRRP